MPMFRYNILHTRQIKLPSLHPNSRKRKTQSVSHVHEDLLHGRDWDIVSLDRQSLVDLFLLRTDLFSLFPRLDLQNRIVCYIIRTILLAAIMRAAGSGYLNTTHR